MKNDLPELFSAIRQGCAPALWSRAVELTRISQFVVENQSAANESQLVIRISSSLKPLTDVVTLWPQDSTWSCSCTSDEDPCAHVAAAVIAYRNGQTTESEAKAESTARIIYSFTRSAEKLVLNRLIEDGISRSPLNTTLVSYVGGIRTGRISASPVSATNEDFRIDEILASNSGSLDSSTLANLFRQLVHIPHAEYNGSPITISAEPVEFYAKVEEVSGGYFLSRQINAEAMELFSNGAALCVSNSLESTTSLRPLVGSKLNTEDVTLLVPGTFYPHSRAEFLLSNIVPQLERKIYVELKTGTLPTYVEIKPSVTILAESVDSDSSLILTPKLFYGQPEVAEVVANQLELVNKANKLIPKRDFDAEQTLTRRLEREGNLKLGQSTVISGSQAVEMLQRLSTWRILGTGVDKFTPAREVPPEVEIQDGNLAISIGSISVSDLVRLSSDGERYCQMRDGTWFEIPKDWLRRYGQAAEELLSARMQPPGRLKLLAVAAFCEEISVTPPIEAKTLREKLELASSRTTLSLPQDLTATLREYQLAGVSWINTLRESGFGALLADDMGLGKTIQALCSLEPSPSSPALIIAPTSVIYSWAEQISSFRPTLKFCLYHGSKRFIDPEAAVIITSYGVLRSDPSELNSRLWQTIIADEAQQFKNPLSLTAQNIFKLDGEFKIALTGTPIENSLEDLWSIFQFINPGLLGTLTSYRDRLNNSRADDAPSSGEVNFQRIKRLVKPFILRRLKDSVAKELPEKTTVILHNELTDSEQDVYNTVLASTKQEILSKLKDGASPFSMLECLLRLRQVCCYPGLVPGVKQVGSSKIDLLVESLREDISTGHRVLVFSQWTSLLDVVEVELRKQEFSWLRLDGQTRDRQQLVDRFQRSDGPPIFLLSLKAGGAGLTLTAADHVYLLDPWWNPAVENQAADRAHRIGQDKPVLIRRLIAKNTIEEKIVKLQERKSALAEAITEGTEVTDFKITAQDVLDLLEGG